MVERMAVSGGWEMGDLHARFSAEVSVCRMAGGGFVVFDKATMVSAHGGLPFALDAVERLLMTDEEKAEQDAEERECAGVEETDGLGPGGWYPPEVKVVEAPPCEDAREYELLWRGRLVEPGDEVEWLSQLGPVLTGRFRAMSANGEFVVMDNGMMAHVGKIRAVRHCSPAPAPGGEPAGPSLGAREMLAKVRPGVTIEWVDDASQETMQGVVFAVWDRAQDPYVVTRLGAFVSMSQIRGVATTENV